MGHGLLGQHRGRDTRRHCLTGYRGCRLDQQVFPGEIVIELHLATIRQGDLVQGSRLGQQRAQTEGDQQSGEGFHGQALDKGCEGGSIKSRALLAYDPPHVTPRLR